MTAQPISCDNDHGVLADMMVTNLHNGDTQSYCTACVPAWARALADVLDPPAAARVDAEAAVTGQDVSEPEARPNGRRPRSRARQTAPVPTGPDDQSSAPTAEPAPDDPS